MVFGNSTFCPPYFPTFMQLIQDMVFGNSTFCPPYFHIFMQLIQDMVFGNSTFCPPYFHMFMQLIQAMVFGNRTICPPYFNNIHINNSVYVLFIHYSILSLLHITCIIIPHVQYHFHKFKMKVCSFYNGHVMKNNLNSKLSKAKLEK